MKHALICAAHWHCSYLEVVGAVEFLQWVPEGQRRWKLSRGRAQVFTGHVQLFFIPLTRMLVAHSGEMPQVPRHGSRQKGRTTSNLSSLQRKDYKCASQFKDMSEAAQWDYTVVALHNLLTETPLVGCATQWYHKKLNICRSVTACFLHSSSSSVSIRQISPYIRQSEFTSPLLCLQHVAASKPPFLG